LFKIIHNEDLTPAVHLFEIEAPEIARKAQAGQFVIVMADEKGERIPLTVADWNIEKGTITIIFMEVGKTTCKLATLRAGDSIAHLVGPLGLPTHIEKFGTVVCLAGGFGTAVIVPVTRALKQAGNHVISIMGFRTKDLLFWEERLRSLSDELIVTTDDGTYGRKGVITAPLKELLESGRKIDLAVAIGPTVMMKFSAATTRPFGVKTVVSLNALMVDGTGMCGCCRVEVGGQTRLTCVQGTDFDGHLVDWDQLTARQCIYRDEEQKAIESWKKSLAATGKETINA
jgi:NAD(P)H-flavin reductase